MTRINQNIAAFNSYRNLSKTNGMLGKSLEKLSSGFRINRAADDAAGLAISEKMRGQIGGLAQAQRNAQDGVSLVQTGEGALNEVHSMLQRMRDLKVQSNNGTLSSSDKSAITAEANQLAKEISAIRDTTEFNGVNLLAKNDSITMQVGFKAGASYQIKVSTEDLGAKTLASGGLASVVGQMSIGSGGQGGSLIALLDTAIDNISQKRADFGAKQNRLEATVRNNANVIENQSAARSRVMDTDFAAETANLTRTQILQQAGTAMLAQANSMPQNVRSLLR